MKVTLSSDKAPAAIGPYSQGSIFKGIVFTSGQLPLDAATMEFVDGGIKEQTYMSLANLKAVLEEGGASLETVIKTTCFLSSMDDFAIFNEVYADIFGAVNTPARSCVEVARLPKDALVEVEAIAYAY